jgi:non-ribosomal peptide synthetase component F
MLCGAVFHLLLWRYSGQEDLAVGTPVAGRSRPELEPLIGFFVNTVVLRLPVTAELRGRELLRTYKDSALEAFAHQDVPFERVVETLKPERDLSRSPFFQVMFSLARDEGGEESLEGLRLAALDPEPGSA